MSAPGFRPPRLLERLLRSLLPPGVAGDAILGDLREEASRHVARGGRLPRVFWTTRALRLAGSYAGAEVVASGGELLRELGRAVRGLRRRPGSSASAVVVIALGIGLSATMASVAYGLFIRGLDVPAPAELRVTELQDPVSGSDAVPPELLRAWRERTPGVGDRHDRDHRAGYAPHLRRTTGTGSRARREHRSQPAGLGGSELPDGHDRPFMDGQAPRLLRDGS